MQVHRSKGVTTLKLTKRESEVLKQALDLTSYIAALPGLLHLETPASLAAEHIERLLLAVAEKETVA